MLILNAGLDAVEFSFNRNVKNPKLGGLYRVDPGQTIEVPEEAESLIEDRYQEPFLKGLRVLRYGSDVAAERKAGLQQFIASMDALMENERQRVRELQAAGYTDILQTPAYKSADARRLAASKLLRSLETDHGEPGDNAKPRAHKSRRADREPAVAGHGAEPMAE